MSTLNPTLARTYSRLGQRGAIFGMAALEAAESDPKLMLLTADLASLSGLDRYVSKYPDQFLNIGIAEQNMLGISAGLSAEGYHPIVTTYATFITMRSCEQIRHYLGYMGLKVIVIGSGAGLIQSFSGNTHYSIEDISIIRAIPNITILSPADAGSAVKAFEAALNHSQPVYIRLTGGLNCPVIYKEDFNFTIGKAITIKEGTDIVVFATGVMVSQALKVADIMAEKNISVKVIDMHTIKPLDKQAILNNHSCKLFVSLEEHNIIGGLGGAVAEVISEYGSCTPLLRLGIHDTFNLAGDYNNLLEQNRLTPELIAEDILQKYKSL